MLPPFYWLIVHRSHRDSEQDKSIGVGVGVHPIKVGVGVGVVGARVGVSKSVGGYYGRGL